MLYKSTNIHPLVDYIKNWKSFNAIDRKLFRLLLLKLLAVCVMVVCLIAYIVH